ncbi:MAG TPA: ATP-binding protein [Streptosporangiaceae bacterium]|nr:ATP-binding protein [Streptosporangiaceae bacterium]
MAARTASQDQCQRHRHRHPPDELTHIFDRFFRGQHAAGIAASGIGLTIVNELVRAHHGQLDVASTPGHGTKIIVILPRA